MTTAHGSTDYDDVDTSEVDDVETDGLLDDPDDDPDDDTGEGAGEGADGSHEAAKYRRRLREAESERDALKGRLETLQKREAERLAGQTLADGSDLWTAGTELAGLLDDAGDLDPGKVTGAAKKIVSSKPHWGHRQGRPPGRPVERMRGGSDPTDDGSRTPSWSEVIAGARKG